MTTLWSKLFDCPKVTHWISWLRVDLNPVLVGDFGHYTARFWIITVVLTTQSHLYFSLAWFPGQGLIMTVPLMQTQELLFHLIWMFFPGSGFHTWNSDSLVQRRAKGRSDYLLKLLSQTGEPLLYWASWLRLGLWDMLRLLPQIYRQCNVNWNLYRHLPLHMTHGWQEITSVAPWATNLQLAPNGPWRSSKTKSRSFKPKVCSSLI